MKYIMVSQTHMPSFLDFINDHLENGWIPQGGPFIYMETGAQYFCQALIKKTKDKPLNKIQEKLNKK